MTADLKIIDVARKPAGLSAELKAADEFFAKFLPTKNPTPARIVAAWTSYCRALIASAEFRQLN